MATTWVQSVVINGTNSTQTSTSAVFGAGIGTTSGVTNSVLVCLASPPALAFTAPGTGTWTQLTSLSSTDNYVVLGTNLTAGTTTFSFTMSNPSGGGVISGCAFELPGSPTAGSSVHSGSSSSNLTATSGSITTTGSNDTIIFSFLNTSISGTPASFSSATNSFAKAFTTMPSASTVSGGYNVRSIPLFLQSSTAGTYSTTTTLTGTASDWNSDSVVMTFTPAVASSISARPMNFTGAAIMRASSW